MATMALHSAPAFSHGSTSYASSSRAPAAWEHPLDHAPTYCPEVVIDIPASADLDVDRLLEPVGKGAGTLRCRVRRMREKGVLELFVEEGNIFVLSASKAGKDWLIFEQGCGSNAKQQQKQQHVARVRAHKDRTFTCIRARLDGGSAPSEPEMASSIARLNIASTYAALLADVTATAAPPGTSSTSAPRAAPHTRAPPALAPLTRRYAAGRHRLLAPLDAVALRQRDERGQRRRLHQISLVPHAHHHP